MSMEYILHTIPTEASIINLFPNIIYIHFALLASENISVPSSVVNE